MRIVSSYRASQPHGWPGTSPDDAPGVTLGGHTTHRDFTFEKRRYRLRLLVPDPTYVERPADPELAFARTLDDAFGAHYTFRYRGGAPAHGVVSVQSYAVSYRAPSGSFPAPSYGADLYLVWDAGPGTRGEGLRWIQVARGTTSAPPGVTGSYVDSQGRANPFYPFGGPTSVHGTSRFSLYAAATVPIMPEPGGRAPVLSDRFVAEAFLVRDTRTKNQAGKGIVEVYGGLRYGWELGEI